MRWAPFATMDSRTAAAELAGRGDNRLLTVLKYPDRRIGIVPAASIVEAQRRGQMRQDLKVVLVFLLFIEVMHSLGYVSGWW